MIDYAEKIKKLRRLFSLTQSELADLVGIRRGAISQIELGRQKPSLALVSSLVTKLNINYSYFFEEETPGQVPSEDLDAENEKEIEISITEKQLLAYMYDNVEKIRKSISEVARNSSDVHAEIAENNKLLRELIVILGDKSVK